MGKIVGSPGPLHAFTGGVSPSSNTPTATEPSPPPLPQPCTPEGLTGARQASSSARWAGGQKGEAVKRGRCNPGVRGCHPGHTHSGLPRAPDSSGEREEGYWGARERGGREKVSTHVLRLAPLLLRDLLQLLHLGPQLRQLLLVQPTRVGGRSVPAPLSFRQSPGVCQPARPRSAHRCCVSSRWRARLASSRWRCSSSCRSRSAASCWHSRLFSS